MSDQNTGDSSILFPILRQIPLFAGLDEQLHQVIVTKIVMMYYPENYELFKEGDEGDALYIIKTGEVEIFHPAAQEGDVHDSVAKLATGSFFGEMALVSDDPRNASARTTADSEIFILSRDDFKQLLDTNAELAAQVSNTMVSRMKDNA
jgi:CRP-like cAMP-binding protein